MESTLGNQDSQTVDAGGRRTAPPRIAGVQIRELANVLTRSGCLTELFRREWVGANFTLQQVNWVQLNPQGVTDWHLHRLQTDQLAAVGGIVKLALWDGREDSPTYRQHDVIRMGALRPVLVTVPPGVWHALRNESGAPAGYLNVIDQMYNHTVPDNWRLPSDMTGIPDIL